VNLRKILPWRVKCETASPPAYKGGEKEEMNQDDGYQIAKALLIIGGIVALAFGATELGSLGNAATLRNAALFSLTGPLMTLVVGAVALVAAGRVAEESFAIMAAVLGFIVGGAGGVLVAIAGISAIASKYALHSK
jgi:hypothetical protein